MINNIFTNSLDDIIENNLDNLDWKHDYEYLMDDDEDDDSDQNGDDQDGDDEDWEPSIDDIAKDIFPPRN